MSRITEFLESWLKAGGGRIGQILVRETAGEFELRHAEDESVSFGDLKQFSEVADAREVSKYAEDGEFRPLRAQSNLARGWVLCLESPSALLLALDAIYPGAIGMWAGRDSLRITPLRDTLERQTGMYRFARTISDEGARSIIAKRCEATCLRQVLWPLGPGESNAAEDDADASEVPLLCAEACNLLVSDARKVARTEFDSQ